VVWLLTLEPIRVGCYFLHPNQLVLVSQYLDMDENLLGSNDNFDSYYVAGVCTGVTSTRTSTSATAASTSATATSTTTVTATTVTTAVCVYQGPIVNTRGRTAFELSSTSGTVAECGALCQANAACTGFSHRVRTSVLFPLLAAHFSSF
jgi:hypothetical protein